MRKIPETRGSSYAEASTGLEALTMVRSTCERGSPYSVVLMDRVTANRELLQLVADREVVDLPVIIGSSAFSTEKDKAAALASSMRHYLEKPIARTRLLELVSSYCRS